MRPRARTLAVAAFILLATAGVGLAVTGGVGVDNTVVLNDDQGPEVAVVTGGGEMGLDGPSTDGQVEVVHDNGEATISGPQGSTAQLDASEIEGTWTRATSLDTAGGELTIEPADKPALSVSGAVTAVEFTDGALDDGSVDLRYLGTSSSLVTVRGLQPNTDIAAVVGGSQTITATTDGGGSVTLDLPESPSASLTDVELVTTSSPDVDEASASPQNGTTVSETPVELSINVSDADFGTTQGDSVDVRFYDAADDSEISTDTLTANGTATASFEPAGGTNEWYAVATDEYGNSITSQTFSFQAPDELVIRNEEKPDEVLSNVNISVTAYYGDETIRRSTENGRIDLSGFPIDRPVIVRASAENYTTRTAIIESIIQQNSIYLLNESVNTHDIRYTLEDPSGQYTSDDTVLFVERDLERNGSVEWRTIAGDNFGVQGTPVTLEAGERYRLRIENLETGQMTVIGAYTAIQSETVVISPGSATIEIVDSDREYGWSVRENESAQNIRFEYFDTANETDSVTLTVHERFNKSNVLINNVTFTEANNIVYEEPITANQTDQTWMAEIYVERNGETNKFREPVSGPTGDIVPGDLGDGWRTAIGVFLVLATGMMFSSVNQSVGAIATSLIGGLLWQVGLLALAATGPAIVFSIAISVIYHYRGGGA